jgi:pSer/pThr/pTyr-binding forkhead associated (FHA) protein
MQLFVSLGESSVNELKFDRGPIYIGRQMGSQVFLPDKSVSRQHAVLYTTRDGNWVVEDLGSSNKTYLNSQAVHKNELTHNDVIRIADFLIRVSLQNNEEQAVSSQMEDTLVGESPVNRSLHTVERNLDAGDAPPVKFPAKRVKQLHEAIEIMNRQPSQEKLFQSVSDLLFRQMKAMNIWMAFRKEPTGPMDIQLGRKLNTEHIERTDLAIPASLAETLVRNKYLLVHQLPRQITNRGIRSVLIAPIMADKDNHGVIYIENSTEHSHYSLPDLDYLILLTIHAAHLIRKL